jgi:hypothetical protein
MMQQQHMTNFLLAIKSSFQKMLQHKIGKTHYQPQVIAFCTCPLHAPTSPQKQKQKHYE